MTSPIKRRQSLHRQLEENESRLQRLQDQIEATHRLALVGTTTAQVAHEFNNILMLMSNYAEQALARPDDVAAMRKALEKTIHHCNQAALIINGMLGLLRNHSQEKQPVQLDKLVKECFVCLGRNLRKDQIEVHIDIPPELTCRVVPCQLEQVLLNLIINARQAMQDAGGRLEIEARAESENQILIRISDTGCGIDPDHLDHVFEPFFSTKTQQEDIDRRGTGLGLAICKDLIEAHGGAISVTSTPGEGTQFCIRLPAS
ncbi:MAG: ATP-binding protein [Sedimentisphaerales bacterium]|nr:ATP-binding protein [Sedimentisphaerales bacterium]